MRVHGTAVKLEWPFMFLASFQLLLLARDGALDRLEGAFFVSAIALFTLYAIRLGRTSLEPEEKADLAEAVQQKAPAAALRTLGGAMLLVALGVALLVFGGDVLLRGALEIARAAGMSERVIGLTIVAAGTGMPEVATSIVAARRGQSEIALGNVIGSNIFNILGILGVTAMVTPVSVAPRMVSHDMWWMIGFSLALLPMMRSRLVVGRLEGGILVAGYIAYVALLLTGR
jgi:cation:H+ antiporter